MFIKSAKSRIIQLTAIRQFNSSVHNGKDKLLKNISKEVVFDTYYNIHVPFVIKCYIHVLIYYLPKTKFIIIQRINLLRQ